MAVSRFRYSVSYFFESEAISVVEIKRDIPSEADKSKLYFWFIYDKRNDCLIPLQYVSLKKDGDKESRIFEDKITLLFDSKMGELTDNAKTHKLKVVSVTKEKPLPDVLKDAIEDYFVMLSFK